MFYFIYLFVYYLVKSVKNDDFDLILLESSDNEMEIIFMMFKLEVIMVLVNLLYDLVCFIGLFGLVGVF